MDDYRSFVRYLKKNLSDYKISVRRMRMAYSDMGSCECTNARKKRKEFLIKINASLNEDTAIETAIHEASHIFSWFAPGDDHGLHWGKSYSKTYNIYLNWLEDKKRN